MVDEWRKRMPANLGGHPIEIAHRDIFAEQVDVLVSPANSFGFMDGGIDKVYIDRFGADLQIRLRQEIQKMPFGELPVGMTIILPTNDAEFPWIISAPTMRVPSPIMDPIAVRLATRAALGTAYNIRAMVNLNPGQPRIESIAFPGMGALSGQVAPALVSYLMLQGFSDVISPDPLRPYASSGQAHYDHFKYRSALG